MSSNLKEIVREIQLQELYLLHHNHGRNLERLENMVAPGFYEIANNGSKVERDAVIDWLLNKDPGARWELSEFSGRLFGRTSVHLVYHAIQVEGKRRPSSGSWRSSVWRWNKELSLWQICFHQATSVS